MGADDGFVAVGVEHDTVPFAVNAIRVCWHTVGKTRYPQAGRLLVTAGGGGWNGYRLRAWKVELARLAAETGLEITVCHFPPGTSTGNRVEHRLFSFISINWPGRPLTDYQVIVETIAATRTRTGLTVEAVLDTGQYPIGVQISDAEMKAVPISRHDFHGEWNYVIHSGPVPEFVQDKTIGSKGIK